MACDPMLVSQLVTALEIASSGHASIRSKQTTKTFGRFDLGVGVGRMLHRHDQLVTQSLITAIGMVMDKELPNSVTSAQMLTRSSLEITSFTANGRRLSILT